MIRPLTFSLAAGVALLAAPICGANESFPVVHSEPITVRVLSGQDGKPLAHLHLIVIAGYDQSDLRGQRWREETLTDAQGQALLSGQLANLPWLQLWVKNKPLCQTNPRKSGFSVERIRRDGLSAPNRCGTATVADVPGVFTVFVMSKSPAPNGAAAAPPVPVVQPSASPAPVCCGAIVKVGTTSATPSYLQMNTRAQLRAR